MRADDYVVKPAEPRVIDARIKAVGRRAVTAPGTSAGLLRVANLEIDTGAMSVTRDGDYLALTATEIRLLVEFAEHPNQALSRQALLKRVWDYGYVGDSRIVDAAVSRLRAKIEDGPHRHLKEEPIPMRDNESDRAVALIAGRPRRPTRRSRRSHPVPGFPSGVLHPRRRALRGRGRERGGHDVRSVRDARSPQ